MNEKDIFTEHSKNYLLCFNDHCPRREQCLRWILKDYVPDDLLIVNAINPGYKNIGADRCSEFKSSEKRRMAIGMTKFYDEMPRKTEQSIRHALELHFGHTMYYLYRRGDRPITPAMQEEIRKICKKNHWEKEPVYDGFREEYEW